MNAEPPAGGIDESHDVARAYRGRRSRLHGDDVSIPDERTHAAAAGAEAEGHATVEHRAHQVQQRSAGKRQFGSLKPREL